MSPLEHVAAIGDYLDELSIPWVLGGSIASSLVGEPRSTNDVDIAVRLTSSSVPFLIDAVADSYYAPRDSMIDAARTYGSSNLLHLASGFKVDLFFLGNSTLDHLQFERREQVEVPGLGRPIWVTSIPDIVLRKLWWYRLGREVSDRQWNDVISILRVQADSIDADSLKTTASSVDLADLVERAFDDALGSS